MQSKLTSAREIDRFTDDVVRNVDEYLRGEHEQERRELEADPDYRQWLKEINDENDREMERYWLEHCAVHGSELGDVGYCALCVQEEGVNDL